MINILQLIRWKNLILISISQIIIIWSVFSKEQFTVPVIIYILCTFCFAAAGNIINDIFDIISDNINKPNKVIINKYISKQKAYVIYFVLNTLGLFLTLYGSYLLKDFNFILYGLIIITLLYIYSAYLKGTLIVGNIVIAFFTSLSLLFLLLIFNSSTKQTNLILVLSLFAFLINWIREIIKDIEDINGDNNANLKTLPIIIGIKRTVKLSSVLTFITIICLAIVMFITDKISLKFYIFTTLILPLSYIFIILKKSRKKNDFSNISKILKLIIVFGIFTILFT
ncbi:UbiA family prenyltransferase [Wenyingzhuangia sp. IMCC45467]